MTGSTNQSRPKAVFFGTPDFAVSTLEALLSPGSPVDVVLAVTQPDRPVGRSQIRSPSPVKATAIAHGVPVRQPLALRRPSTVASIASEGASVGIVVAYGRILPADLLDAFPLGCLNVHGSVLPRWRGAWPIGAAIRAGDSQTGVSIMRLDAGMDTGPVLATQVRDIGDADTTASLTPRLAADGASLLLEVLPRYLRGDLLPVAQDDSLATWCHLVTKADGAIDWQLPAAQLVRHVRAMHDWPGAWTTLAGRRLVVHEAREVPGDAGGVPGFVRISEGQVTVATGKGSLGLVVVQAEGRAPVDASAFARGQRALDGTILGE